MTAYQSPLSVNFGNPISDHPANAGLVSRYLYVPGRLAGAWVDMSSGHIATQFGTPVEEDGADRPGAWGGVDFNGSSGNYETATGITDYIITGNMTLACWARYTSRVSNNWIVSHGANGEASNQNLLYAIRTANTGADVEWFHEYGNGSNSQTSFNTNLDAATWYHLMFVRDDTAQDITLYVDGVHLATTAYTNSATGGTVGKLAIGSLYDQGSVHTGHVDDVCIWNRTCDAAHAAFWYQDACRYSRQTLRRWTDSPLAPAAAAPPAGGGITAGSLGLCGVGI